MKNLNITTILGYFFIAPALYTIVMIIGYLMTKSDGILSITPINNIPFLVVTLLLLPTLSFALNTSYNRYSERKGQRMLNLLIGVVCMMNVVLFISACTQG